ncbi:MAG: linked oxidase domain protein, partial [Nocardioides sp.]|nr:linked oxidase domain protein [Nocardioides sp.]
MSSSHPDLVAELRRRGVADVDDSTLTRALYSSDASLYRVVPEVVVRPREADELLAVLDVSRSLGVPLTMRGAGTSIAGNAVGEGIVVDTVRHLNRVLSVDPGTRTAVVQPGVVHAALQRAAGPHGLRFGPDPSTHTRCTVGGMIGNNACGSRALGYGRTVDNVAALRVAFGTGEVADLGPGSAPGAAGQALAALADEHLGHVRTTFGRFGRQVSGYSMEHLLPEQGRRLDRFLVGSEGTLGLVLEATVDLVRDEPVRRLVVLGYPSMVDAADAVPGLLAAGGGQLIACEGLDSRIVDLVRARGSAVPDLPRGAGWLFVEVAGEDADALAARVVAAGSALEHRVVSDPAEAAALWRIREDGAGLAARSLRTPAYSGWEDAAVPPEHLGAWLRDFDELLREHRLDGVPYGHFGDGCVHVRIDFPFHPGDEAAGKRVFRDFLTACALKLRDYDGSLSGEHGDGRARSELLPLMYDEESLGLFAAAKAICDPANLLNPGNIVDPVPFDADLRALRRRLPITPALRLVHDGGSLGNAVHRCTGVGKCVAPSTTGVMCPSYLATREEKDSTRGRSRVLQEALDGTLVGGLADPAVGEALDLCLSCKGCASDCPTGVDMATYKAEALHQKYAGLKGLRRP